MNDFVFEDPRDLLARHRLGAKRRFSQNFLVSEPMVRAIARAVGLRPNERCVELGPGLGTLTGALVASGAQVTGVERDPDMLAVLREELGDRPNFHLVDGDAARVNLAELMGPDAGRVVVVGNLPYSITGMIARNLVEAGNKRAQESGLANCRIQEGDTRVRAGTRP